MASERKERPLLYLFIVKKNENNENLLFAVTDMLLNLKISDKKDDKDDGKQDVDEFEGEEGANNIDSLMRGSQWQGKCFIHLDNDQVDEFPFSMIIITRNGDVAEGLLGNQKNKKKIILFFLFYFYFIFILFLFYFYYSIEWTSSKVVTKFLGKVTKDNQLKVKKIKFKKK